VKNKVKSFAIWDLNGILDFSDSVDYFNFETIKKVKIKVHLYGKESDLFAGLIIKEIEVK
jgi:abortive infection bacteriophage resistance protein